MSRVVVVTRHASLAMGLDQEHDVVDLRPAAFAHWLGSGDTADVVVLDVGTAEAALRGVMDLRSRGREVPVLLVGSTEGQWQQLRQEEALADVHVLPLPLSFGDLAAAVRALTRPPAAADYSTSPVGDDRIGEPGMREHEAVDDPTDKTAGQLAAPILELTEPRPLADELRPAVPTARRSGPAGGVVDLRSVGDGQPEGTSWRAGARRVAPASTADPSRLVEALLPRTGELAGLHETATVVLEEACSRLAAEGGALLVADGPRWRVAGGVGLRPLERRAELSSDSWLVALAAAGRAVVIEDTDIARQPLRGVPLASWKHLLAVPLHGVPALMLIARHEDPAFTVADLARLHEVAVEAGPLLQAALSVRELARALAHHQDDPSAG